MSGDAEWRWADPSGQQRLVRTDELRAALASGVLAPNTPVWQRGWKEWRPAQEVAELTTSALSAANGVLPNIPPPPLAVVAVQAAFEGGTVGPKKGDEEPPPPPRYVPAPTHVFHTPSTAIRSPVKKPVPTPPPSQSAITKDRAVPVVAAGATRAVNHRAMKENDVVQASPPSSGHLNRLSDLDPPTVRPSGDDRGLGHGPPGPPMHTSPAHGPTPAPTPAVMPKPIALAGLVRPAPGARASSRPPPPPRASVKPPPPVASHHRDRDEDIEELSGSMLLPDASGSLKNDGIEELSGSVLLADASGSLKNDALEELSGSMLLTEPGTMVAIKAPVKAVETQPVKVVEVAPAPVVHGEAPVVVAAAPVVVAAAPVIETPPPKIVEAPAPTRVTDKQKEELSGSFLLDAGSTGALPSLGSDSAIRVAPYVPAPAPFAAESPPPPYTPHPPPASPIGLRAATDSVIAPLAMPLGPASIPPPQPALAQPITSPEFVPRQAAHLSPPPASNRALEGSPDVTSVPHGEPMDANAPPYSPYAPALGSAFGVTLPAPEVAPVLDVPPAAPSASGSNPPGALPTLVGVPPPPDLLLAGPDGTIAPAPSPDVVPPPAAPTSTHAVGPRGMQEAPVPPAPERSSARVHDFRSLSPDPRAKYVVPALAALGLLVGLGMIGLVVGAVRKKPSDEPVPASTFAAPTTTSTATAARAPAESAATGAAVTPRVAAIGPACTLAGAAHVIAPRAVVQSGVEVAVVGSRVALGFASGPRAGIALAIDPSSLAATQTARVKSADAIRRLVPVAGPRGVALAADFDRADTLGGRRTVSDDPPFDLGFGNGGLAWAAHRSSEVNVIWTLDGDAPVEAVRAAPLDPASHSEGWAIAFRRGASIYAGVVGGTASASAPFVAKGPLVKVDGLGSQVGSPAVAAQDGAVLVAWADRASSSDPWSLRWMRFAPGDAAGDAKPFVPAAGGLGEHAMSPSLAPAGQGRFVLAWTEGPIASHQVRAQTISAAGVPLGAPFAVSEGGVNAGQAQLAVLPDGHGVVAYLGSRDGATGDAPKATYQVMATPIACP